jgi:hypothetical protein
MHAWLHLCSCSLPPQVGCNQTKQLLECKSAVQIKFMLQERCMTGMWQAWPHLCSCLLMPQVSLATIKACLWRGHAAAPADHATSAQTAAATAAITLQLNRSLAAMHLTTRDAGASTTVGSRSKADGKEATAVSFL